MAQTVEEFCKEVREAIDGFEVDWKINNQKNPDMFPNEFEDGNEGLWWDMFDEFLQRPKP